MDRNTILWALVLFFGASLAFSGLRNLTEGEGAGVTLAVQLVALVLIVGVVVAIVRRRGR